MDEVAGRGSSARVSKSDNQEKTSDCAQCADAGKFVSAAGFCLTCNDFLCTPCIDQHKIMRGTKDHELQEGDGMLNSESVIPTIEKCAIHSGRRAEAYCKDEDIFGCFECFTVGHRSCKNIGLISVLSQEAETSKEFLDVQKAAERCNTLTEECRQAIQKCMSINEVWQTKTLEDFQKVRSEILSAIDEIEENISKEAEKLKEENEKQLTGLAEQIEKYSEQVKQFCVNIDNMKARKWKEQLFLALKKNGRDVVSAVQRIETLYQDISIKTYKLISESTFTANLIEFIKINVELTRLPGVQCAPAVEKESNTVIQKSSPATSCTSESKVNIKSPEDRSQCYVTGIMELSPTQLILSDSINECLKLFDLMSSTIIKRQALESPPRDVTLLSKDRFAVSLPSRKRIQIFTADKRLDPCESINVSGDCHGLQCTEDQLVVSFISPVAEVQVLDLTGHVLHSFQHDAARNALFKRPIYHILGSDNKHIYVSDISKDSVTCMDTSGAVKWVYQDRDLKFPLGVSSGDGGSIYVCSNGTNRIHVISSDGSRLAVIPQYRFGVKKPQAVCYSSYHRTLYVSSSNLGSRDYISKLILQ